MSRYFNPAIKQLTDHQIKFAPREARLKQIDRAERLLNELEPNASLRYPELCEKITSYRGEMYPDLVLTADEAVHDLRCFVEDLSDSADISSDSVGEDVWTVEDVSKQYNVSTKTVSRWRDRGLVSRRFKFGGRKRVGFLRSSVERFVSKHAQEVDRSTKFTQLSLDEREALIQRARRLARAGGCPTDIHQRLARKFGRSPETVRYTLKNFDRQHPESAVYTGRNGSVPLTDEQRLELYRRYKQGTPVESLTRAFQRTKSSVHRVVAEVRAEQLLSQPIEFIDSPVFHESGSIEFILGPAPARDDHKGLTKPPPGLPPYLDSLYTIPLLTKEEEVYYFRKMNYLKYLAAQIRGGMDLAHPKSKDMDEIENLLEQAVEVKNFLIRSNLRLVVSIAKRHIKPNVSFFEMVSDGNMSLIKAIEKFDFSRGFKFSTYASWAIMKNYARSIPAEFSQLDRFRTGNDEVFIQSSDPHGDGIHDEMVNQQQHHALMGILNQLPSREREIIVARYGLDAGTDPLTLEQVGAKFGVTKERIRQIESRALEKLRRIAEEEHLDVPGVE